MRVMHVMGGGDVGGAKTQIMNTVTGLSRTNDVMLISFRAGPFADEARERGIDVASSSGTIRSARRGPCAIWWMSSSRTSSTATAAART
ncbi:MAG: hypothetical protein ACLR4Z_18635 [Butyricicoccaceae bacterium]